MPLPPNPVDKLLAKVQLNVGRAGDSTMDDYTIEYANVAQRKICNKANFWFMRASESITFLQGTNVMPVPDLFKDEDIVSVQINDSWRELDYVTYQDIRKKLSTTQTGTPLYWNIDKMNLYVYPIPNVDSVIQLDFWQYMPDLVVSGDSNSLLDEYPDILEAYATWKALRRLREFQDAADWLNDFEYQLKDLIVSNADRELPSEFVMRPRSDVYGSGIYRNKGRR